jgi:hypothetical protein
MLDNQLNPSSIITSKDYLKHFPIALISTLCYIVIVYACSTLWLNHTPSDEAPDIHLPQLLYFFGINTILILGFWVTVAFSFPVHRKASWIAALVQIVNLAANLFIYNAFKEYIITFSYYSILSSLIFNLAPFLVFGWIAFKDQRIWILLAFGIYGYASNSANMGIYGIEKLFPFMRDWFKIFEVSLQSSKGNSYYTTIEVKIYVGVVFFQLLKILIFCELMQLLSYYKYRFQPNLINLHNSLSKWQVVSIFYLLRITITLLFLGLIFFYFANNETQKVNLVTMGSYFLATVVFALFVGWYYRKFMCEYLYAQGQVPSWNLWLCSVPVLGLIIFFFIVFANDDKESDFDIRVHLLNKTATINKRTSIMIVIGVIQCLSLFSIFGQSSDNETLIWTGIFGFIGIIMFMGYSFGIYIHIGLEILLLLFLLHSKQESDIKILFCFLSFCNIIKSMLLFAVFHPDRLIHYSPDDQIKVQKLAFEHDDLLDA